MDNERIQWAARMLALLEPLKSRLTPGGSGFALGATAAHYETATIPMEAFSRPLWALVPFWAGGGPMMPRGKKSTAAVLCPARPPAGRGIGAAAAILTRNLSRWRPSPTVCC